MNQNNPTRVNRTHRDARTIEADLARDRAELEATVDKLQYKFRPGEVFDQAWRYARRRRAGESEARVKESLVRNPLPVALIGVGVAWLLLAGRDGSVPSRQLARRRDSSASAGAARESAADTQSSETGVTGKSATAQSSMDANAGQVPASRSADSSTDPATAHASAGPSANGTSSSVPPSDSPGSPTAPATDQATQGGPDSRTPGSDRAASTHRG